MDGARHEISDESRFEVTAEDEEARSPLLARPRHCVTEKRHRPARTESEPGTRPFHSLEAAKGSPLVKTMSLASK